MKEQSQIEDMRAALRGDRERAELARRRPLESGKAPTESPPTVPPAAEPTRVVEPYRRGVRRFFKRR